ncbi:MAG: hypothetical protein QOF24_2054 [Verrucomicrobiota bacterium]|jgi:hypothetical protein
MPAIVRAMSLPPLLDEINFDDANAGLFRLASHLRGVLTGLAGGGQGPSLDKRFANRYKVQKPLVRTAFIFRTWREKKVTWTLAPLPSKRALEKAHHKTEA